MPCLQGSAIGPYSEPDESSLYIAPYFLMIHFNIILLSMPRSSCDHSFQAFQYGFYALLFPFSALKTVCSSETLAPTGESTWRQNPKDHHVNQPHRCENLKPHTVLLGISQYKLLRGTKMATTQLQIKIFHINRDFVTFISEVKY